MALSEKCEFAVSVKDVYGFTLAEAQEAMKGEKWEIVDFRHPLGGEQYLSKGMPLKTPHTTVFSQTVYGEIMPRLIVKPRPPQKRVRLITIAVDEERHHVEEGLCSLIEESNPTPTRILTTIRPHGQYFGKHRRVRVLSDSVVDWPPPESAR